MRPASQPNRNNPPPHAENGCIPERVAYLRAVALRQCRTGVASMPDDPALVRQWRLIKILSGNRYGATVRELAEEMHVAEKTIRRDLQDVRRSRLPAGRDAWRARPQDLADESRSMVSLN